MMMMMILKELHHLLFCDGKLNMFCRKPFDF